MKEQYKIYNGDRLDVMDKLIEQGVKVDAIITDPPYGTTACKWDSVIPFDEMWKRLNKLIKDNGAIILFATQPFSASLINSNIKGFKHEWIWQKEKGVGFQIAKYRPMQEHEHILVFSKKGERVNYYPIMTQRNKVYIRKGCEGDAKKSKNDICCLSKENIKDRTYTHRYPKSILKFNRDKDKLHPTQKPVELLEYLIKTYTNEGEVVLDFTMGSGSTGVACVNTNRKFIGIELDETYFNIAKERIEEAVKKKEELLTTFDK